MKASQLAMFTTPAAPAPVRDDHFSPCRRWRYWLSSIWEPSIRPLVVVGLNPSKADKRKNDPTVERVETRAHALGLGGFVMLNLFAWVSTEPAALLGVEDPVGEENDRWLREYTARGLVLCAWGTWGPTAKRDAAVLELLRDRDLHVLKLTRDGHPNHPLYLPYALRPTLWRSAA